MHFLTPDQQELKQRVRALVEERLKPIAEEIAAADVFPEAVHEMFKEAGLYKLALSREWGGPEAGTMVLSLVISEIARVSGACALIPFPTNAVLRTLCLTASEEQKRRWLPQIARGDKLAAFCLTEPNYGSDAGSLILRAVRQGDRYVLNGSKIFITLGVRADYYLVFARTGPGRGPAGVSAFLVEKGAPGLRGGHVEKKMGLGGSITQELLFEDCQVSAENLLLGEGQGWRVLTAAANPMRLWGAGSLALGIAEGAFEAAVAHARTRRSTVRSGGHIIGRMQSVRFMLANMKMKLEAARSLIHRAARMIDAGLGDPDEVEMFTSMGKAYASDMAMEICTDAVQILGREGVRRGNPVERMFRDVKAVQIFDGSNQVQRMIIARHLLI